MVRTWDRNATQGRTLADFPGSIAAPPSSAFTETLNGSGSTAYSAPWPYVLSQRDQLGNLTTFTVDPNGNNTAIRPPRGNQAGNSSFDITRTFDQNNNLLTTLMPLEASANKPTAFTYDALDNRTSTTDPDGNVTTFQYDTVNRRVGTLWTRSPFPSDASQVPPACRQSTAGDAPIPAGRILCSTAASYDGVDNKLSSTDGNHQVTTYTYDGVRRLVSQLVPRNDGTFTTLRTDTVYDADGNVTDVCPPNEFARGGGTSCSASGFYSAHRSYDVAGRVVSATTYRTAGGTPNTTTLTYDADGKPRSATDPNGHTTTTVYNLLDRKVSVTQPRDASTSNTTTWNYDPAGNTTSVIQPGNRITAYSHDAANRLIDTVRGADSTSAGAAGLPDASGGTNIRTRIAYDADGHPMAQYSPSAFASSTTNPNPAFMTRVDIDQDGRTSAVFQPRYDAGAYSDLGLSGTQPGQCTTTASPQPVPGVPGFPAGVGVCVARYQYDPAGRHTRTVLPTSNGSDNRFVDYAYTDDGLAASVSTPSPAQAGARVTSASYLYDGDGKQVKQTDALGDQQTTSYTSDELVAQQAAQPNGSVTHVTRRGYDANGNPTSTIDALGNKATTGYYADNLTQEAIDPAGDITRYVHDQAGNLIQKFSPSAVARDSTNQNGVPITNTYTFDNLLSTSTQAVTPPGVPLLLQRTRYGYDPAGRKTSGDVVIVDSQGVETPGGGPQFFAYYNDDRLSTETGRRGETINHTYDPNGNETATRDSTSGGSTISSTFYLDNRPRTVDDGSRTSQYTYDGEGQRAARATLVNSSSSKSTTTYTYGDAEQTLSMSSSIVGGGTTSFTYDAAGRLATAQDPNGQKTAFTFNPDDTLGTRSLTSPSGASVASFTYTYDSNFQITSQTFTGQGGKQGKQAYTYDAAGRLSGFTEGSGPTQTVTFDHDGNRLTFGNTGSSSYNPDDTLASSTDASGASHRYIYSFRGDLINDGCNTYAYDGFDRMTGVSPTGATGCPATPGTSYTYDGLDRQRTTGSTALHYDGTSSLVSDQTSSSGTDTAYELSPNGQARAVAILSPVAGSPQYLSDDGQGNITTVTTSTGALACSVRYDPWGSPLAALSPSNPCDAGSTINDHFYRGQRLDPVTGNYQLGNRAYSPSKASFISPDTYRIAQPEQELSVQADPLTQNRYSYVNGDPVNLHDPDGHCGSWWNPSNLGCHARQAAHWVQQKFDQTKQWVSEKASEVKQVVGDAVSGVVNTITKAVQSGAKTTSQWVVQHRNDFRSIAKGAEMVAGVASAIGTACAIVGAVAVETVVGGIAGGACAGIAFGVAAGASVVALAANAAAKAGGADVSYVDLAMDAVGAVPGVGMVGRAARLAKAAEGTGAFRTGFEGLGEGLGKLEGANIKVSEKGLAQVERHLQQFGPDRPNEAMVGRLQTASVAGQPVSGADASFYMHELAESTLMRRGMSYEEAHAAALEKYGVSPYSVYHPEVIDQFPRIFNKNWRDFWSSRR